MPEGKLTTEQIRQSLQGLAGWDLTGDAITKQYKFESFAEAMAFVNQASGLAEAADHHPDIDIRYNTVRLTLSTHSADGLTSKDFALARQIG